MRFLLRASCAPWGKLPLVSETLCSTVQGGCLQLPLGGCPAEERARGEAQAPAVLTASVTPGQPGESRSLERCTGHARRVEWGGLPDAVPSPTPELHVLQYCRRPVASLRGRPCRLRRGRSLPCALLALGTATWAPRAQGLPCGLRESRWAALLWVRLRRGAGGGGGGTPCNAGRRPWASPCAILTNVPALAFNRWLEGGSHTARPGTGPAAGRSWPTLPGLCLEGIGTERGRGV